MRRKLSIAAVAGITLALTGGILAGPASAVETKTSATTAAAATCTTWRDGTNQTYSSGVPTCGFWFGVQGRMASDIGGYTGPINGVMGVNSWKGVQRYLNHWGANLTVDGAPGPATYRALQSWLNTLPGGQRVAVDGQIGPATYRAWAYAIITLY